MPTKLVEAQSKLEAKRREVAEIFKPYEEDPTSVPAEIREDLRVRTKELGALTDEVRDLAEVDAAYKQVKAADDYLNKPATGMTHPGQQSGQSGGTGNGTAVTNKSIGQQFVESPTFLEFDKSRKSAPTSTLEAPLGWQYKTVLTETGFAPQAIRIPTIVEGALQRPTVADLVPQGQTNQIAIVYMEETTTTNAAAATAEGDAKPESALAFTQRTANVQKVATVLPVTEELMADVPAMRAYVDARLRLFVLIAEDTELLGGNGTPPHIRGFLNATNLQTQALGADNRISAVLKAMTKIEVSTFLPADGIVMHPTDWQTIRLYQETTGGFVLEHPGDPTFFKRLWGLPIITTTAISQGTALVGAFATASQMFRRADLTMAISTEHSDFFIRNEMMLRAEERFALALYRGAAFCTVTGL